MSATQTAPSWIDYWDSQDVFDEMMATAAGYFFERAATLMGFGPEDVVLDIGCGTGDLEACLAGVVAEIHGVDTSPSAIERARCRFAGRTDVHFHLLDRARYTDLSFLAGLRFTRVICLSVVQYYRDPSEVCALVESAAALAAPGARLLIADVPASSGLIRDTWGLLTTAASAGLLSRTLRFLVASLRSGYRHHRKSAGYLIFPPAVLRELVERIRQPVRVVHEPLTLNSARVHLLVTFPGEAQERP